MMSFHKSFYTELRALFGPQGEDDSATRKALGIDDYAQASTLTSKLAWANLASRGMLLDLPAQIGQRCRGRVGGNFRPFEAGRNMYMCGLVESSPL